MAKEKFDTEAMSGKLESGFELGDAGVFKGDELFETFLKESGSDKTLADVKQVQGLIGNFVDSATLAFGRRSIDAYKSDKELETTEAKVKVGGDKLRLSSTRKSEAGVGEHRTTKYGSVKVNYLVSGGPTVGELKKIRALIGEEAHKALAD
jgi:hypothetical protein